MDPEGTGTGTVDAPDGWTVWHAEPGGRIVLAFRPDVFDASAYPAPCLPTVAVAPGRSPDDPPGRRRRSDRWHVAVHLEPGVRLRSLEGAFDDRDEAVAAALEAATRFAGGEVDVRSAYVDERAAYLDRLEELIAGRG